jgi:hypothetical protein
MSAALYSRIGPVEGELLNDSVAKIIGLPEGFGLAQSLRAAKAVTLVMAFAKQSGWLSIKEALLSGKAGVDILVGLNFDITEPAVLSEWLGLQEKAPYRFTVRVAPLDPVFHPKVILVQRHRRRSLHQCRVRGHARD